MLIWYIMLKILTSKGSPSFRTYERERSENTLNEIACLVKAKLFTSHLTVNEMSRWKSKKACEVTIPKEDDYCQLFNCLMTFAFRDLILQQYKLAGKFCHVQTSKLNWVRQFILPWIWCVSLMTPNRFASSVFATLPFLKTFKTLCLTNDTVIPSKFNCSPFSAQYLWQRCCRVKGKVWITLEDLQRLHFFKALSIQYLKRRYWYCTVSSMTRLRWQNPTTCLTGEFVL